LIARRAVFAVALFVAPAVLYAQGRLPAPTADSGLIGFDDDGLRIHSPDRRMQLKLRGYVSIDARTLFQDTSQALVNGIALRRSRITFDVNLNPRVAARLLFDIGPQSGPSGLADAFVDVGLVHGWWLRAGKQKTPVGYERYLSSTAQLMPERSIVSNLHGSRDLGLLLTGSMRGGLVDLSLGVFNGVPDGSGTADGDANDGKDVTYRVWVKPVRKRVGGVEQGAGFAFNGSTGLESSPLAGGARLPLFRSPAQLPWFQYGEINGVRARGRHTRNGAFAYLFQGRFGAQAEAFKNTQVVARVNDRATVATTGWMVGAQWSVTGEPAAAEGLLDTAAGPGSARTGASADALHEQSNIPGGPRFK
jgi:hypothetical protein